MEDNINRKEKIYIEKGTQQHKDVWKGKTYIEKETQHKLYKWVVYS